MRLTAEVRQKLLNQNEGFEMQTSSIQKNLTEYRTYRIAGGQLYIRSYGNTSWADSHFDNEYPATPEQTHRFLRQYQGRLNTDGL